MDYVLPPIANGVKGQPQRPGSVDSGTNVTVWAVDQFGNINTFEQRDVILSVDKGARFEASGQSNSTFEIVNGTATQVLHHTVSETVTVAVVQSQPSSSTTQAVAFVEGATFAISLYSFLLSSHIHTGVSISTHFCVCDCRALSGAPVTFELEPLPRAPVNTFERVIIHVLDQFGNLVTTEQRDVTVLLNSTTVIGEGVVDIASGTGFAYVFNTEEEVVRVTLQDTFDTGLNSSASTLISFVPGPSNPASTVQKRCMCMSVCMRLYEEGCVCV